MTTEELGGPTLQIGEARELRFFTHGESEQVIGALETHPCAGNAPDGGCGHHEGEPCTGSILFDVPGAAGQRGPHWDLVSWRPLTISPSVRCSCGNHGFIREGKWVPV